MAFSDKLRELLDLRQMRPVDLAKAANISEAIVSTYLSGKKEPKGRTCIAIATVLNVSLDDLLETGLVSKEKSPAELSAGEALINFFYKKYGRPPTQAELEKVDKLIDLFIEDQ